MAVIGIITCEILELEVAYLLARDPDVGCVHVVEDDFSASLIEAMGSAGGNRLRKIARVGEFSAGKTRDRLEVLLRVMELGLHNRKRLLQEALIQATREMGEHVDAIMLGYGLCGNALDKPEEMLKGAGVPLFLPMDTDHPVDDCIGLILGGRDHYYAEQCRIAGTFYMIPGFARHWKRMLEKEFGRYGLDLAKRMFVAYERTLIIPTPALSEKEMRPDVEAFNRFFGLRSDAREGTLAILKKTWENAKAFLRSSPLEASFK